MTRELDEIRMRFVYYFRSPEELPVQAALWWAAQSQELRYAIMGFAAVVAIYLLAYARPAVGSLLATILPYGWVNTDGMRRLFFKGTGAEFEKTWRKEGAPTRNRARYLADAFYYWGPVLVVAIALVLAFIAFSGYPRIVVPFDAR